MKAKAKVITYRTAKRQHFDFDQFNEDLKDLDWYAVEPKGSDFYVMIYSNDPAWGEDNEMDAYHLVSFFCPRCEDQIATAISLDEASSDSELYCPTCGWHSQDYDYDDSLVRRRTRAGKRAMVRIR